MVTFTYKIDVNGQENRHKTIFRYPVNRLYPEIDFDPIDVAVFAADRASFRFFLALIEHMDLTPYQIDIKAEFLCYRFDGAETLYVLPPSRHLTEYNPSRTGYCKLQEIYKRHWTHSNCTRNAYNYTSAH